MRNFWKNVAFVFGVCILLVGCASRGFPPTAAINNFDLVAPGRLYRGAQPNYAGLEYLRSIGIRSVLNLREPGDAWPAEAAACDELGLTYTDFPLSGLTAPTATQAAAILAILDTLPPPIFIHCQHGCERTGLMIGAYRIRRQGWTAADAWREARIFGLSSMVIGAREFLEHEQRAAIRANP
jgi:protein tyrosine/serine phosphatase